MKSKFLCNKFVALLLIIVLQVSMVFYISCQKQEYHIDEIYSYALSNIYDIADYLNKDFYKNCFSGADFLKFVTVQNGERFAYDKVYWNNTSDAHPPLFYWILHTICSFTPDLFTKWSGLGMNIVLFVAAMVMIYLISCDLISDKAWRMVPLVLYGCSGFAVDTVTFIRMYMLLTVITLLFVYSHIRMLNDGVTTKRLLLTWVSIYLGAMTQYYSIVVSFWGVLFFAVYLLYRKQIKQMFIYGIGACISIAAMLLSYPFAIMQATGSATNNIGNEVMKNLFNFKLWMIQTINMTRELVLNISYKNKGSLLIVIAFTCAAVFLLWKNRKKKLFKREEKVFLVWLTSTVVFSCLSISFIGGNYVYLRYIYHIIPFFYIIAASLMSGLIRNNKGVSAIVVIICVVFAAANMVFGAVNDRSHYLFKDVAEGKEQLKHFSQEELYILSDYGSSSISPAIIAGNLTRFEMFDSIYVLSKDELDSQVNRWETGLTENGSGVLFIPTDKYWINGFDAAQILEQEKKKQHIGWAEITKGGLGEFYYVYR